jgi:hypothetical protein
MYKTEFRRLPRGVILSPGVILFQSPPRSYPPQPDNRNGYGGTMLGKAAFAFAMMIAASPYAAKTASGPVVALLSLRAGISHALDKVAADLAAHRTVGP